MQPAAARAVMARRIGRTGLHATTPRANGTENRHRRARQPRPHRRHRRGRGWRRRCARAASTSTSGSWPWSRSSRSTCRRPRRAAGALDHCLFSGPPGLGKTSLAHIIASELGVGAARHLRPGAGEEGRPGRPAHQPGAARRALHRRDPPAVGHRRGVPLPGHGGLPARHHHRHRPGGARDEDRPAALHAHRRHHPHRPADLAAARPLPDPGAARLLRAGRSGADPHPLGAGAGREAGRRGRGRRSPGAPAARRASPTGCCAACATSPRSRATAASPARWPTPPSSAWTSTPPASTRWTAASS